MGNSAKNKVSYPRLLLRGKLLGYISAGSDVPDFPYGSGVSG
jgi:hypothetical protein